MTHPWPDTNDTLIARLQNPADRQAWHEFASLYEPIIFRFAKRRGLQDADAEDITQRVLWAVARAADRWEPGTSRGRFRGWLARVTSNAVINMVSREQQVRGSGRSSVHELLEQTPEASGDVSAEWQHGRRCELFRHAAARVKNKFTDAAWQAFWLTAVDGLSGVEASERLGISIGAVYAARSRVLAKIRMAVAAIEEVESNQ